MEHKNITLIGMAGVGKSSVGEILAQSLGHILIDTDKEMEKERGKCLQDILDEIGEKEFLKFEARKVLADLEKKKMVLAPGGSIVYSQGAMRFLKQTSTIVYLSASAEIIEKRIDTTSRGIIGLTGKTFAELYTERKALYKKFADIVIETEGKTPEEISRKILKSIKKLPRKMGVVV